MHSITLVNDLEGDGAGQRAMPERADNVRATLERTAARDERSVDMGGYFEAVVGPLYSYALILPGLVPQRAPVLVEAFLACLEPAAAAHGERDELRPPGTPEAGRNPVLG